ncbi:MAG: hypothetical protein Q4G09_00215 [Clostridia bacterium]|nr:hypothetical protein [Clostridia bacterium]
MENKKNIIENKVEVENSKKENKDLPIVRKLEIYDMLLDSLFEISNYTEAVLTLRGYGLTPEEVSIITTDDLQEIKDIYKEADKQEEEEQEI